MKHAKETPLNHGMLAQTRLPVELHEWVAKAAESEGISIAAWLRRLIMEKAKTTRPSAAPAEIWVVWNSAGETSGGLFNSREAAEQHLENGMRQFPGLAESFRVVRIHQAVQGS